MLPTALLIVSGCLAESSLQTASLPTREANQFICGPRCVQHVLDHYGKTAELMDLVSELQGPAIAKPANLWGMKQALKSRGIYAVPVRISIAEIERLGCMDPVIVHLRGGGGGSEGHFIVCSGRDAWTRTVDVWDGLNGTRRASLSELPGISGNVLITSATKISSSTTTFHVASPPARYCFGAAGALIAIVLFQRLRVHLPIFFRRSSNA